MLQPEIIPSNLAGMISYYRENENSPNQMTISNTPPQTKKSLVKTEAEEFLIVKISWKIKEKW